MAAEPRPARGGDEPEEHRDVGLLTRAAESLLLAATSEAEVVAVALRLLSERFGYGTCAVMLHDPAREELRVANAVGIGADRATVRDLRVRLGEGLSGTAALYRRLVNVPDVRRDTRYLPVIPECASEICVPILTRDDLLGVLVVESPQREAFGRHDEVLLTSFSQLVALALVHARAHQSRRTDLETIRAQLSELQAVHEVAQRAASLDLDGTLHAAVDAFQRLTTADTTGIYLWDQENEWLALEAVTFDRRLYPADYEERLRALKPRLGSGLVGWVAEHRQPLLIADVTKDPRMVQVAGVPLEAKSGIVVPVIAEDRLLGVIRAWKMGTASFTNDHFRLAQTLASETALVLAAVRAHRQQAARISELGTLHETSLSLSEAATPDEVLNVVLRAATQIAAGEAGVVWRRAPDGSFVLAGGRSVDAAAFAALPAQTPETISNEMFGSGRPVLIDDLQADERIRWARAVPQLHAAIGVPLRSEGVMYGSLFVLHSRPGFFRPDQVRHVEVLAAQAAAALARAHAFEEARRLAITDELTGCYNARYFTMRLAEEMQRAQRYGHTLSLIMMDSDSLKMVNDRFGHEEGNRHLIELANTIREHVRQTDIVARFGGDEFLILQPETELAAALLTADRIRSALFSRSFVSAEGQIVEVSVSGGVASYPATAREAEELFRQADHALYVAKRQGKNVVAPAPINGAAS